MNLRYHVVFCAYSKFVLYVQCVEWTVRRYILYVDQYNVLYCNYHQSCACAIVQYSTVQYCTLLTTIPYSTVYWLYSSRRLQCTVQYQYSIVLQYYCNICQGQLAQFFAHQLGLFLYNLCTNSVAITCVI